jgi:hypothetical protein
MRLVTIRFSLSSSLIDHVLVYQFIDYTAGPLHEQLSINPPTPKFHAIIDAYGLPDASLYIHSEAYLAPDGIFVSAGPQPDGFGSVLKMIWHFALCPRWAGGTNRKFRYVFVAVVSRNLDQFFRVMIAWPNKTELEEIQKLVAEGR